MNVKQLVYSVTSNDNILLTYW